MFTGLLSGLRERNESIAVIGLGYVGLPLAIAFAKKFRVIGYDNNESRIKDLGDAIDYTGEVESSELKNEHLFFTSDPSDIAKARFITVTVPTPVDKYKKPDLCPILSASVTVGKYIKKGSVVVFESTVYPGVTQEECVGVIERESGLKCGVDFKVGYSPERINPGDKEHKIDQIKKVVSGQDEQTLEIVSGVYGDIISAGVHMAPSIKVAEAAKVIENIQRDINIALVNEFSMIFNLMGIKTSEVLDAANTKWNFIKYSPGLVGGHCIGVDPYYLTAKAGELGYDPQIILSGRRINDGMGKYVAQQAIKLLINCGKTVKGARAGVLGLTFKENVPDLRNSRVPDILDELNSYGVQTLVHDPFCDPQESRTKYRVNLYEIDELKDLDMVILAVAHDEYMQMGSGKLSAMLNGGTGVVVDVKSALDPSDFGNGIFYWSL